MSLILIPYRLRSINREHKQTNNTTDENDNTHKDDDQHTQYLIIVKGLLDDSHYRIKPYREGAEHAIIQYAV